MARKNRTLEESNRQIIHCETSRHLSLDSAMSRHLQESLGGIDPTGTSEAVFV